MGITSTGIGSNLDVEGIIKQLMAVEKQPLTRLATKEASHQAKLSGFGTLKSVMAQFQSAVKGLSDPSKFQNVRTTIADTSVATVSGTSSATPGTYALEVTKLAQAQKLVAAGQTSENAAIGKGTITIDFGTVSGGTFDGDTGKYSGATFTSNGSGAKTITIDDTNNSLVGIRDAINKANIGVTASIVNDGGASPYRLALSVGNTGKTNSLKISVSGEPDGSTGLSTLLNHDPAGGQALSETATAQNAEFEIDGIAISKASNTVTDVIAGLTLNLSKTNVDSTTNITVARDTASVASSVNAFVKAYNEISQTLKNAMAYNADTKTAAILNGEASVRGIQTQLRSVFSAPVAGGVSAFTLLSQVGVSLKKDGLLAVDDAKLQTALSANFNEFAGLFAAAGKASDSLVSYSSSTDKTQPGSYAVNITRLATQGTVSGKANAGMEITGDNDTVQVQLDGIPATVKLAHATYANAAALAAELQSKINGANEFASAGSSVKVIESGGKLTITSNRYGSASNISIGGTAMETLGFAESIVTAGVDVAGTINGFEASGSGQSLTSSVGDSSGISIKITGGALGNRGTVNYSQGYAYQFDKLAETLLGSDGPIASRIDGINKSIKSLEKDEERINTRLVAVEKRYRAQFTALDTLMSKMTSTATFLTQQLANLPSISDSE